MTAALISVVMMGISLGSGLDGPPEPAYGTYAWPVEGPVIRGFEPPPDPYGPGHRGIDIGAPLGTDLVGAEDGVVAFAGWVGGSLFISIDHEDGVRSTYSWLSAVEVVKGDAVVRGQVIGRTGRGHSDVPTPHLHFGTRIGETYIDPLLMLERGSVVGIIHLAPLVEPRGVPPPAGFRPEPGRPYNGRSVAPSAL
jgi:murein DD-endopeptidase MepM/ murein hydrolase activator NlpD